MVLSPLSYLQLISFYQKHFLFQAQAPPILIMSLNYITLILNKIYISSIIVLESSHSEL